MMAGAQDLSVPSDGGLEVATAIQEVSDLVSVDPSTDPFTTVPDELFTLTFNDPQVGISDLQMRDFKARLGRLLPSIKNAINRIPENAGQEIGQVARIVRLALGGA